MVANRRFADLGADSAFALDDLDLAPFFGARSELPLRWCEFFRKHELVLSYLNDPSGIFEQNVRACGVKKFFAGSYRIEEGAHASVQLARPLSQLGIAVNDFAPRIKLNPAEREMLRAQFGQQLITLHPGSGSPGKNWPIENWTALIEELLSVAKCPRILVIGGESDEKEIVYIRERFEERVDYATNWPLRKLAVLLSHSRFVGHDSGISHLAVATGARCTILFGATDPEVWAPRNENAHILIAPEKNLRRLGVAEVRGALSPVSS